MRRSVEFVIRAVLVVALLGSVVVQVVVASLSWADGVDLSTGVRVSLSVIGVLGVVCLQLIAVCVWRLLTMVRYGTVFSTGSFRLVDGVIGALATGSLLVFAVAVVARFANHATPGDEVAPGVVGFICGLSLVVAGVALVVYVMRVLLAQAVELDAETKHLQAELRGVI
jgi:hypothetical protein